tara:strand:+ start:519 stop:692 length:174 start_codon:yes stop_codon:yes gene_type:complete
MFGKIYETTWWGNPIEDGWGDIYFDETVNEEIKAIENGLGIIIEDGNNNEIVTIVNI